MLKKRLTIGILLVVFLLIFSQNALLFSFKIYLSYKASKAGHTLSYEKVEHEGGKIALVKPRLEFRGGRGSLDAEKLEVSFSLHPFESRLNLDIDLESPILRLTQGSIDLESLPKELREKSAWGTLSGSLRTTNGLLHLEHIQENAPLPFELHLFFGSALGGELSLFDPKLDDQASFNLSVNSKDVSVRASHFPLKTISNLSHALFPSTKDAFFDEGTIDGTLLFNIEEQQIAKGEGLLNIREAKIHHSKSRIFAKIPEIQIFGGNSEEEIASMEFLHGSLLFADTENFGAMRSLKGHVSLSNSFQLKISSEGIWNASGQNSFASLNALFQEGPLTLFYLGIDLHHLDPSKTFSKVQIKSSGAPQNLQMVEVLFKNVREREFAFAERVLETIAPGVSPIHYISGTLDANIHLEFPNDSLGKVSVENLFAENLSFVVNPWELSMGADKISGNFSFDLSLPSPKDTISSSLQIDNGSLALTERAVSPWHFTKIQTQLDIKEGIPSRSSASVELAGLKGTAEILSDPSQGMVLLEFKGTGSDLLPFVPERIRQGIEQKIAQDSVVVAARVDRILHGVEVTGSVDFSPQNQKALPPFLFGFTIDRIEKQLIHKNLESEEALLHKMTEQELLRITPPAVFASIAFELNHLKQEVGYSGFRMRDGWFKGTNIPLDRLVGPFLFPEKQMMLFGDVDIEGIFDAKELTLRYGGRNISLENEKLHLQIPELEMASGNHMLSLTTQEHFGKIPLNGATYFDKSTGLLFSDIAANVFFEGERVHIDDVETYSNGLYLAGSIDIDYSSPEKGAFDVSILAHTLDGTYRDACHFFSHFDNPHYFTKIPLEATLSFGEKGLNLFFGIKEDDYLFDAKADLQITDGELSNDERDLSLKEFSLNLLYDHQGNSLALKDLQGILLARNGDTFEEYSIHSKNILVSDYEKNRLEFDIALRETDKEFARIVGKTEDNTENGSDGIVFCFDLAKTHLGEIAPKSLELTLSSLDRIEHFRLGCSFRLSTLLHDLERLGLSKFKFLPSEILDELKKLPTVGGELNLDLSFNGQDSTFLVDAKGHNLLFGEHAVKDFSLKGSKRDDRLLIEHMNLDKLSIAAEIRKTGDLFQVDFLGAKIGQAVVMGLEGSFRSGEPKAFAKVNLFEADLSELFEFGKFEEELLLLEPHGKLKGSGELVLERDPKKGLMLDILINASLKNARTKEFEVDDVDHLAFHYSTGTGWDLNHVNTFIKSDDVEGKVEIDRLSYNFNEARFQIGGLHFAIAEPSLRGLGSLLQKHLPDWIDEKTGELIRTLKTSGTLSGKIDLTAQEERTSFRIMLADGTYNVLGKPFDLKGIEAEFADGELRIFAKTVLNDQPIFAVLTLNPDLPDQGVLMLADTAPGEIENPALLIHWREDPKVGLVIDRARGHLAGLDVDLKENASNSTSPFAFHLSGSIGIDAKRAENVFPELIRSAIQQLGVGSGYRLKGDFEFAKESKIEDDFKARFFGVLEGENVELKGYRFNRLHSQVVFEPHSLQLFDCTLSDPACTLYIVNLRAYEAEDGQWWLDLPRLTARELRPHLLQEVGAPPVKSKKPLVVREFSLENIRGVLKDPSSLTGTGFLVFENPEKKNSKNFLFSVPKEILKRIGLNLSVLTPVSGTIFFDLHSGLFYLTKFKDVYSDGKISKFYLSPSASTIDLDGNLNIQVRFKQSTLLLKLAEMFTVNVQGTLKKPKYSLQRQKYLIKQEEVFVSQEGDEEQPEEHFNQEAE